MTRIFLFIFVLMVGLGCFSEIAAQIDPNEPDSIWVDSAVAFTGGIGIVPIYFFNDEELSALEITLRHHSNELVIDSFSFIGGRLDLPQANNPVKIDGDTIIVIGSFLGAQLLPAGSGLAGKLYLSYPPTISPQVIPIDTLTWIVGFREHSTTFKGDDFGANPWIPQFKKGYLDIKENPAAMDSIWVDNIDTEAGRQIAVPIYYFNERNIAEVAVALDYGSTLLQFDSVSFLGSRSLTASSRTVQAFTSTHKLYIDVIYQDGLPLTPGSGLLADLFFTVEATSPDTLIVIDTTTIGPAARTEVTLTAADGDLSFYPFFTAGSVDVRLSLGIEDVTPNGQLPADYALGQNYPNPFNPVTNIEFSLPRSGEVTLEVFNILGARVRQLVNEKLSAGVHRVTFDSRSDRGAKLASGVYFYRLITSEYTDTRKMLLLK